MRPIVEINNWWRDTINSINPDYIEICQIIDSKSRDIANIFLEELKSKWKDTITRKGLNKWKFASSHSRALNYKIVIQSETKLYEIHLKTNEKLFKRLEIVWSFKTSAEARDRVMWWYIYDFVSEKFIEEQSAVPLR